MTSQTPDGLMAFDKEMFEIVILFHTFTLVQRKKTLFDLELNHNFFHHANNFFKNNSLMLVFHVKKREDLCKRKSVLIGF